MKRFVTTTTLIALLGAPSASAQQSYVDVADDARVAVLNISVENLDDKDVYDVGGREIGEVEVVLGSDERTPTAIVIDFNDHIVEHDRIVQIADTALESDRLVIRLDQEALQELERYDE
ncbi:MAG: PRC-barrel domain-containing protein [Pseudomonadota bacterium]|nr:PRC-barrel domain-containing protein [Pseudomonadota bacterium]